jgi:hypothetical protein
LLLVHFSRGPDANFVFPIFPNNFPEKRIGILLWSQSKFAFVLHFFLSVQDLTPVMIEGLVPSLALLLDEIDFIVRYFIVQNTVAPEIITVENVLGKR